MRASERWSDSEEKKLSAVIKRGKNSDSFQKIVAPSADIFESCF